MSTYTDADHALAAERAISTLRQLGSLIEGEDERFRHARRAAVEVMATARWAGRGEYEQMSAALHTALAVLGVPASESAPVAEADDTDRLALDQIIRDADGYWPDAREAILRYMASQRLGASAPA